MCGVFVASFYICPRFSLEYQIVEGLALVLITAGLLFRKPVVRVLGICLGLFLVGVLAFGFAKAELNQGIGKLIGSDLVLTGQVISEPDVRDTKSKLIIGDLKSGDQDIEGQILLEVHRYPEYKFGQILKFEGKLEEAPQIDDFSYKDYLAKEGISALVSYPKTVEVTGKSSDWFSKLFMFLLFIKSQFLQVLNKVIPEPYAAFMAGILVGAKRSIDMRLQLAFALTGTSHIVAISGYNISVITSTLGRYLRQAFSPVLSLSIMLILVTAFVLMVGGSASVVRAAIMGMIVVFARVLGRKTKALNMIVLACSIMVFINPLILRYDVGFQLSVLAILGLVLMAPKIDEKLERNFALKHLKVVRGALADTLAAMIFTLPLLFFNFDRFTVLAPLVNMMIIPFLPYVMGAGFVTGLAGLLYLPLGQILGLLTSFVLAALVALISWWATMPAMSINVLNISPIAIVIYYLLLGLLLFFESRKNLYLRRQNAT